MSLIDLINQGQSIYSFSNLKWRQFVVDYKKVIIDNSVFTLITGDAQAQYQYDLKSFLRDNNISPDFADIICLINDMRGPIDFSAVSSLYIPPESYIKLLYQTYQTTTGRAA